MSFNGSFFFTVLMYLIAFMLFMHFELCFTLFFYRCTALWPVLLFLKCFINIFELHCKKEWFQINWDNSQHYTPKLSSIVHPLLDCREPVPPLQLIGWLKKKNKLEKCIIGFIEDISLNGFYGQFHLLKYQHFIDTKLQYTIVYTLWLWHLNFISWCSTAAAAELWPHLAVSVWRRESVDSDGACCWPL